MENLPHLAQTVNSFKEKQGVLRQALEIEKEEELDKAIQISIEYRDLEEKWKEYHDSKPYFIP